MKSVGQGPIDPAHWDTYDQVSAMPWWDNAHQTQLTLVTA